MEWLMAEGGTVIRYRTARDLLGWDEERLTPLAADLHGSEIVEKWLQNLTHETRFNAVHGSKDTCIENALQKLVQLGLKAGHAPLDDAIGSIEAFFAPGPKPRLPSPFNTFKETLVAAQLANAGYGAHREVARRMKARAETVSAFARTGDTDIFIPANEHGKLPGSFEGRGVIRDDLYNEGNLKLPWIHDLLGWDDGPGLDDVLAYILSTDYQALPWGYGILWIRPRRFLAMGWSIKLAEPSGTLVSQRTAGSFLWHLSALSKFRAIRESAWFVRSLAHLDRFRRDDGTWEFPRDYLPEKRDSYMVGGGHMGLGENRRRRNWRANESTFWRMYLSREI